MSPDATRAAPTAIANGDHVATLWFQGYDGTQFTDGAAIYVDPSQTWGTAAHGARIYFDTTANNTTADTIRMTIDQNGNVGIGTTTPQANLQVAGAVVAGTGTTGIECTDFSTGNLQVAAYSGTNTIKIGSMVDGDQGIPLAESGSVGL